MMKITKSMRNPFAIILLLLFTALCMPVFGQTEASIASEILPCGPPHQAPRKAYSLLDQGEDLAGQEKWYEAMQAYDKAIQTPGVHLLHHRVAPAKSAPSPPPPATVPADKPLEGCNHADAYVLWPWQPLQEMHQPHQVHSDYPPDRT